MYVFVIFIAPHLASFNTVLFNTIVPYEKKIHYLCSSNLVVKALFIKIYWCSADGKWDLLIVLGFCQALRDGNKLAQMEEAPLFPGESIKVIGKHTNKYYTEYY